MKTLLKLIVLGLAAYGAWFLWQDYDLKGWYENAKTKIDQKRTMDVFVLPKKRGVPYEETKIIKMNQGCVFSPAELEVKKGERATWYNAGSSEQMLAGDNFDIVVIKSGKYFTRIFNEAGVFYFGCAEKENSQDRGKITVN
jgi:plastocyanin